jgi:hypothetical protein
MTPTVREMMGSEVNLIIEYFQNSTPEHLEILDVDPSRFAVAGGMELALWADMRVAFGGDGE